MVVITIFSSEVIRLQFFHKRFASKNYQIVEKFEWGEFGWLYHKPKYQMPLLEPQLASKVEKNLHQKFQILVECLNLTREKQ